MPLGGCAGSSDIEAGGKEDFPSWECNVEVEVEGEGVGRAVSVLAWLLMFG